MGKEWPSSFLRPCDVTEIMKNYPVQFRAWCDHRLGAYYYDWVLHSSLTFKKEVRCQLLLTSNELLQLVKKVWFSTDTLGIEPQFPSIIHLAPLYKNGVNPITTIKWCKENIGPEYENWNLYYVGYNQFLSLKYLNDMTAFRLTFGYNT